MRTQAKTGTSSERHPATVNGYLADHDLFHAESRTTAGARDQADALQPAIPGRYGNDGVNAGERGYAGQPARISQFHDEVTDGGSSQLGVEQSGE
jgi:hypothetical protein